MMLIGPIEDRPGQPPAGSAKSPQPGARGKLVSDVAVRVAAWPLLPYCDGHATATTVHPPGNPAASVRPGRVGRGDMPAFHHDGPHGDTCRSPAENPNPIDRRGTLRSGRGRPMPGPALLH